MLHELCLICLAFLSWRLKAFAFVRASSMEADISFNRRLMGCCELATQAAGVYW